MGQASAKKNSVPDAKTPAPTTTKKQASAKAPAAGKNGQAKRKRASKQKKVCARNLCWTELHPEGKPLPDILKPIKKRQIKAVLNEPPKVSEPEPETTDKVDPEQEHAPLPGRCAMGLKVGWYLELDDGRTIPTHSLRDLTFKCHENKIDVGKVESVRAFLRRRSRGVKVRQASFWPYRGIKSITRAGAPEFNFLEGRMETVPEESEVE
jgi:hypothetical protein